MSTRAQAKEAEERYILGAHTWWVYHCLPIDWGWESCREVEESSIPGEILDAARYVGWEGDASGFYAWANPMNGGFSEGFAWKQGNNGCTFIASPYEMSHLTDTMGIVRVDLIRTCVER